MNTDTQQPKIVMTHHLREGLKMDLFDTLDDMGTFCELLRMASRALNGAEADAIASGAIEILSRIDDVKEITSRITAEA